MMQSAHSLSRPELLASLTGFGAEPFRAEQVWRWWYRSLAARWADMANIPAALRAALSAGLRDLDATAALAGKSAEPGGTAKLLLRLADGGLVETVVIPAARGGRFTVCVSSQVGCAFRCAFCASGAGGFSRQLEAGEIVAQLLRAALEIGARPDNVVFMGVGEPFANYDAALKAARIMNDAEGLGIGARKITFSTCGVVPGIVRFASEPEQFELSVSLHAPDQALRARLMPVAERWPLAELLGACRDYTEATRRIITFEYTLIDGVNNSPAHCAALAALLGAFKCRVNLIPFNPVAHFRGRAPARGICEAFAARLTRSGVNATLRRSKGGGVNASCGQLRAEAAHGAR